MAAVCVLALVVAGVAFALVAVVVDVAAQVVVVLLCFSGVLAQRKSLQVLSFFLGLFCWVESVVWEALVVLLRPSERWGQ